MPSEKKWKVHIHGERCSRSWEITVVLIDNEHGQRSWGWIGDDKLLISHNGGPCKWPISGYVFDQQVKIANEVCRRMNAGESLDR